MARAWCFEGRLQPGALPLLVGQPLCLEIAVRCRGSHLTVFAPYRFQGISALETIGALSCLSSSSTFYLKHI